METLLLYCFLFLFTLSLTNIPAVHTNCLPDQRLSLLRFKKSLVFYSDFPSKLIAWNSSVDCCQWPGVTCSADGRVVGLDISAEAISCSIDDSSSLFDLHHLESLNLASSIYGTWNDFNGSQIPAAIGKLSNLRYLNLSYSGFDGQIPIEISHLKRLVILDLSFTGYLKLENPNLRKLVQNLTELEELNLDYVNISAHGTEWCQAISHSLPKLRVLSLSSTGVSGPFHHSLAALKSLSAINLDYNDIASPVPGFFATFPNLTSLSLYHCGLLGTFPNEIFHVPSLQSIVLGGNPKLHVSLPDFRKNGSLGSLLSEVDISYSAFSGSLPASIGNLTHLVYLNISSCAFSGSLPASIGNLTHLVYLDISYGAFSGSLPASIGNLTHLVYLDISYSAFSGSLPASIGNLTHLVYLDISYGAFSGSLPASIGNLTHLVRLRMSSNQFIGQIDSIPWENLVNLQYLDLGSNLLNGSIPSSLFSLPSLSELDLSYNQFSGPFPELANISSYLLEAVSLKSNSLEGAIPVSIFNLGGLQYLLLSSNNFSSFPCNVPQQMGNLTVIDLSYNRLLVFCNGTNSPSSSFPLIEELNLASTMLRTFPDFLRNFSTLHSLDLSANHIEGHVPNWIWNIDSLWSLNLSCNSIESVEAPSLGSSSSVTQLDLHSNQIQGPITFLLPSLKYLDYSQNNLSSSIPTSIGDLTALVLLSLGGNNLEGYIPVSICNLSRLEFLYLSNNSLSGGIPKCLSQFPLKVLDLRKNNFSGSLSNFEFSEDCELRTLSLSGNEIEGPFPKSIINCTQLEVLDIRNNQIIDTFPCMLKSLSTLRVLILRSNKFYGSIECPETKGTWPDLQILDLSHNNLDGEIPGASLTTWHTMVLPNRDYGNLGVSSVENVSNVRYSDLNYEDVITATIKGLEMNLTKILNVFTLIDLSGNKFNGSIPKELGEFKSLYVLNFSSNCFTGEIPSSFGNMKQLESLDLSKNNLSGQIPPQLTGLTFLAVLDLSSNQLVGRIPTSTQFSTFPKASFQGNKNLWGPPLTLDKTVGLSPESPPTFMENHPKSRHDIDWNLISAEVGFTWGFGIAIGSLLLCKKWKKWYFKAMYNLLLKIFPQLEEIIGNHRRHIYTGQSRWRR